MEKTGVNNIKCVKCSDDAQIGTTPPLCAAHAVTTEKEASDEPTTLREFADNPKEAF